MPLLTPEMRVFTRSVRRMLGHAMIRRMYPSLVIHGFMARIELTAHRFIRRGDNAPRYLMRKLYLVVARLMSLNVTGMFCQSFELFKKFFLLLRAVDLELTGTFHEPSAACGECAICLCGGSDLWWRSSSCGHCFHVGCIDAHFKYDTRCPLCRAVI